MKKALWLISLVVVAAVLAGCGSSEAIGGVRSLPAVAGGDIGAPANVAKGESAGAAPMPPSDEFSTTLPDNAERMIVRTAQLELSVKDPTAAADSISDLAAKLGGFVASANLHTETYDEGTTTYGSITIRTPAKNYDDAIQQLRSIGTVLSYSSQTQDVSKEYVDLSARLRNLQAAEKRLQEIMAQAKTTKDVLAVYHELNQVQGEIEQIKGRTEYLKHSVALATITVQLEQQSTAQVSVGKWNLKGQVAEAIEFLIKTFKMLVTLLIWLVIYILPIAVVLYIVIGLPLKWIVRRVKRSLKVKPATSENETAEK